MTNDSNAEQSDVAGSPASLSDAADRGEYIHRRVRERLESMAQDALYWHDTPPAAFEIEPLWYEIRDAIVSELFDMDREQAEQERHAAEVVRDCL